jgi:hypothetical protein
VQRRFTTATWFDRAQRAPVHNQIRLQDRLGAPLGLDRQLLAVRQRFRPLKISVHIANVIIRLASAGGKRGDVP